MVVVVVVQSVAVQIHIVPAVVFEQAVPLLSSAVDFGKHPIPPAWVRILFVV